MMRRYKTTTNNSKVLEIPDVVKGDSEHSGDNTKAFTFRFVPIELHRQWKILASLNDKTMEDFGLNAIKTYIQEKYGRVSSVNGQAKAEENPNGN